MAMPVDLDSLEAAARDFLAGTAPSLGWEVLDQLECHLAVGLIEEGTKQQQKARKLL